MKYHPLFSLLLIPAIFLLPSCRGKRQADLILYNGTIYTVNADFAVTEAIAVKKGIIISVGPTEDMLDEYEADTMVDLKGKPVYPGLIDAHCHFFGYGSDLVKCDLYNSISFDDVVKRVQEYSKQNKFEWILGRGWDQNNWEVKEFPERQILDSLFPKTPVCLLRVDGHAALCNKTALDLAGITSASKVEGGEIIIKNGEPTGLLIDNAVELVNKKIPEFTPEMNETALLKAEQNCFEKGLTTVDDAGLNKETIHLISQLQKDHKLKMRVYAMISDEPKTLHYFFDKGKIKTDRLNVRSIKVYADGALGSRGACLKQEYSDQPGHYGYMVHSYSYLDSLAVQALRNGFQLCTHAIGDSAIHVMLYLYAHHLDGENERRWRIEHCQVVDPAEFEKFGNNSIIPSVQPTHATSDMGWAQFRLGESRMGGAYAYKTLKHNAGGIIVFGTDFPVEDINPIYTFYAAVARKNKYGKPSQGFRTEEQVDRETALRAMTIWAAYSNFEEDEKGSISEDKFADFIIMDKDIMKINEDEIPNAKVLATYCGGEKVYGELK